MAECTTETSKIPCFKTYKYSAWNNNLCLIGLKVHLILLPQWKIQNVWKCRCCSFQKFIFSTQDVSCFSSQCMCTEVSMVSQPRLCELDKEETTQDLKEFKPYFIWNWDKNNIMNESVVCRSYVSGGSNAECTCGVVKAEQRRNPNQKKSGFKENVFGWRGTLTIWCLPTFSVVLPSDSVKHS